MKYNLDEAESINLFSNSSNFDFALSVISSIYQNDTGKKIDVPLDDKYGNIVMTHKNISKSLNDDGEIEKESNDQMAKIVNCSHRFDR